MSRLIICFLALFVIPVQAPADCNDSLSSNIDAPSEKQTFHFKSGDSVPIGSFTPGGSYILVERLGSGATGEVWSAKDTRHIKARFAVKLFSRPITQARFYSEVEHLQLIGRFVFSIFKDPSRESEPSMIAYYLAEGISLKTLIAERRSQAQERFTEEQALDVLERLAVDLESLHRTGRAHLDVKPGNTIVNLKDGKIQTASLIDFGNAKRVGTETIASVTPKDQQLDPSTSIAATSASKEQEFVLRGTPEYMAPEQKEGPDSRIGTAADIWALGRIFEEMAFTTTPETAEFMSRVKAYDPRQRIQNASEFLSELMKLETKLARKQDVAQAATADVLALHRRVNEMTAANAVRDRGNRRLGALATTTIIGLTSWIVAHPGIYSPPETAPTEISIPAPKPTELSSPTPPAEDPWLSTFAAVLPTIIKENPKEVSRLKRRVRDVPPELRSLVIDLLARSVPADSAIDFALNSR